MTVSGTGSSARPGERGRETPDDRALAADQAHQALSGAAAWNKWFPLLERAAQPLSERMISMAEIGVGARVLDIGTGVGEPALSAAPRVAPGGVTAIDPDKEMIEIARDRAAALGIGNVTFIACRAEELDLPERSFDAILCRWSLMFVDNLGATLSSLRNLLRPGGRLVAATWGPPESVPALSLARWSIHRHFGCNPPSQGAKTAFALSDTDNLTRAFRDAGYRTASHERISLIHEFRNSAEYVEFRTDCTGSLFSGVGDVTDGDRRRALDALDQQLSPFRNPDGTITLISEARCTTAIAAT